MSKSDDLAVDPTGDGMSVEEISTRMAGSAGRRLTLRLEAHHRAEEERMSAEEDSQP
jgi:hypothetical protein